MANQRPKNNALHTPTEGFNINVAVNVTIQGQIWTEMLVSKAQASMCLEDCQFVDKSENVWELRTQHLNCAKCKKTFKSVNGKKSHELKCLGESKIPKCPYCNEYVNWLVKHIKRKHKEYIMPVVCTLCRKKFPSEEHLSRHWTSKVKNKETTCKFCLKKFKLFNDAMKHTCIYIEK